ncbi:synaptotagmin 1-like [Hydractinia symbiolongicarpus]|uniref:synaptotagmin 1-like n=1 Tax=Hydractinia symbiolongicarpus TaxID=13093 RepID=UPI00254F2434|nr:synaptotagmin 1-like [Hydractinia symbiolongicarpus]
MAPAAFLEPVWQHLEKLPLPPYLSLLIIILLLALAIALPIVIILFFGKQCGKCCRKMFGCCIKLCRGALAADDVDYSHIQLTNRTFYEKIHPSADELEFSADQVDDDKFGIQLGRVRFGLEYDVDAESLSVTIYEARDLPSADEGGASDPYIRVMLLPDTKRRYETIVLDATLNPVYEQTFTFKNLPNSELLNRTLCIRALDYDTFPGHDILGETLIPIIDINIAKPIEMWRILVPGYDVDNPGEFRQSVSEYGDICLAMQYMPATGKLSVFLIECKNLKSVDEGGVSDPFVKVTMFQRKKKVKTQKTRYIKQTLNPYYNEEFTFKLDAALVPVTDIRFLVLDYDLFGGADVIGQITVGAHSYGPQLRHWRDMLLSPHRPVACWHMLRSKPKPGEED